MGEPLGISSRFFPRFAHRFSHGEDRDRHDRTSRPFEFSGTVAEPVFPTKSGYRDNNKMSLTKEAFKESAGG